LQFKRAAHFTSNKLNLADLPVVALVLRLDKAIEGRYFVGVILAEFEGCQKSPEFKEIDNADSNKDQVEESHLKD
jgi:hypothetical protein